MAMVKHAPLTIFDVNMCTYIGQKKKRNAIGGAYTVSKGIWDPSTARA